MDLVYSNAERVAAGAAAGAQAAAAAAPSWPVALGLLASAAALTVAAVVFVALVVAVCLLVFVVHQRGRKVRALPGASDTAAIELNVSSSDREDAPDDF